MCQAVCPVYQETGLETDVARGKLSLLDGLLREILKDPIKVKKRLERCLLCGSCQANCPSGVRAVEIFLRARTIVGLYLGIGPLERILLRGVISNPRIFNGFFKLFKIVSKLLFKEAHPSLGTSCSRIPLPVLKDRHIKFQTKPRETKRLRFNTTRPKGHTVAVFVGCVIDKIFPTIKDATLDILLYYGYDVFIPETQACCGIPALSSGDLKSFEALLNKNLEVFSEREFEFIVSSCPTCTWTIKEIWPMFSKNFTSFRDTDIQKLSNRAMDINQFLIANLDLNAIPYARNREDQIVTYHDPCHLRKSLKIWEEPRKLVRTCTNNRLIEMPFSDMCCGMGGTFNIKYYDMSSSIAKKKRDYFKATGANLLTTACPACMFQLHDIFSKNGDNIEILHTIELLSEAISCNGSTG